jgi:peptidylprolyl isomerase
MVIRRGLLVALVLVGGAGCNAPSGAEPMAARPLVSSSPSPGRSPSGGAACARKAGDSGFPPLLGGFDERLATEPSVAAGSADVKELAVTVLIQGTCAPVAAGQTVTVNYVGATLRDGKVFDASWTRRATFDAQVGLAQLGQESMVIAGLDRGLVGVRIGSRVQVDIPPELAYGASPPAGFPAGALRFVVDVLDSKA